MHVCVSVCETADLTKHDLARACIDHKLQRLGVHIQHHLAVGNAFDWQAEPERPISDLLKRLDHITYTKNRAMVDTTLDSSSAAVQCTQGSLFVCQNVNAHVSWESEYGSKCLPISPR